MTFGQLDFLCSRIPAPLCTLVGPYSINEITGIDASGVEPQCFARSIDLANTVIFEVGAAFVNIAALFVIGIIVLSVRSKYTAVGRKEILDFFYLYGLLTIASLLVDSGVVPPATKPYPYFVAAQCGLASATCWCLLVNGFVGFQLYEDGTTLSSWIIRIVSSCGFALTFVVSLLTFQSWGGLSPTNTVGLFVVLYILNIVALVVYVLCQAVLVLFTLQDMWPLGDIALGIFCFVAGQVLLNVFSSTICEHTKHYVDGLIFASMCNLFTVMMIYKYWDSITSEDLEFSVSANAVAPPTVNPWDQKEFYDEDRRSRVYANDGSEYTGSFYALRNNATY
ncbi:chitin synthase III catalytic subunit [Lipomyces oligophaga]|uniref:chitin synthase III catalytic subunit n=1 Tax=Lipomyces oligophaga TaxID=45792 RepID=UPI0034CEB9F0